MKNKIYKIMIIAIILSKTSMGDENFKVKLDETTVTYERYDEISLLDTPKNITIITSEDISKKGYRNIDEALKMVPGLIYTDGSFSMRGQVPKLADKALVVLLDGVPQNGVDNRAYDLDFIPIEKIERIEVVPAGGAIMYGGNATAGVINIITKEKHENKYWGNFGIETGSYDYKKYKLNSGFNITENLATEINYSTSDRNGYRDGEKKDLDFFQGSIAYKLNDGNMGFNYEHNEKKATDRIAGLTKEQYNEDRRLNPEKGRVGKDIQDKYTLNFDKQISDKLKLFSVLEYKEREYKYDYPQKDKTPAYRKRDKSTDSVYLNMQLKYSYNQKSYLLLGGDYLTADVKERVNSYKNKVYLSSKSKIDFEALGGYLLNTYNHNNFIFTQGFRVEKNTFDEKKDVFKATGELDLNKSEKTKDSPTNTNYELTANYLLNDETSLYVGYNRVKRNPSLTEFSSWMTDISPEKNPQTVDTFEVGTKTLINNIFLSGAIFYIHGDKEIMYDPKNGAMSGSSFYNLDGKTKRIGLELSSEQYFNNLVLRESFTYMNNEIIDGPYKGNEIPGISNLTYGFGATYEITSDFIFNIDSLYYGKSYAANDFKNETSKSNSHFVTNISLRYNFSNGISIYGGINNIFNELYCDYIMYDPSKSITKYTAAPERTYYIGGEYKFY